MFQYRIYGLQISSSRRISILREQTVSRADLTVNWSVGTDATPDKIYVWKPRSTELLERIDEVSFWETENENGVFYKVVFTLEKVRKLSFLLDAAKENLWIYHERSEPAGDLESYFVGPVLSFVLRMRGVLCLHSSVVAIDGAAVAFAGHATAGKSTIAAGMSRFGAKILADDIAVLKKENGAVYAQSGYAKIRLRPVAAEFLTDDPRGLPPVYSYRESRYFGLEESGKFRAGQMPLAAIYILGNFSDDYKEPFIEPIEAREKIVNLVKNTSGGYVVGKNLRAEEFGMLAEIAGAIPMRKLFYAHDITTLPRQCEKIIEDFRLLRNS